MPRTGGIYTLPPGYLAVTGQTILASQHNPALEDIASALTGSLPRDGSAPMVGNLPMANFRITGMGNGSSPTDAATVQQSQAIGVPIGTVLDFFGSIVPDGYLLCFGQAVSRTTYAALFAVIGTAGGSGDGSTTFNIPDLRGRIEAGKDNMGGTAANRLTTAGSGVNGVTVGAAGGSQTHALTTPELASHSHTASSVTTLTNGTNVQRNVAGSNNLALGNPPAYPIFSSAEITASTTTTVDAAGAGNAHNNTQPTMVVNKIIKAFHP